MEHDSILELIQQRLRELQAETTDVHRDVQGREWVPAEVGYLPSLAISKVPIEELPSAAVRPVTKDVRLPNAPPFSRAYVNAEFRGRPLLCMLDTGCDRSVIG